MFTFPINHFSDGGPVSDPLGSVIASCCADLDATIAASYGGSGQTWANYEDSPSDGAAQSDYDFHLGAGSGSSTDDPTFTGSAGVDSAFFNLDGGDFFQIKSVASTVALNKAHRSDRNGTWIAIALKIQTELQEYPWANTNNPGDGRGMNLRYKNTSNKLELLQSKETSGQTTVIDAVNAVTDELDTLIIMSWDGTSTTNNGKLWLNSGTATQTVSSTFQTSTTDATNPWIIGARFSGGVANTPLPNGSRVYHWSCGDEFLDDTKAEIIRAHLQARHAAGRY